MSRTDRIVSQLQNIAAAIAAARIAGDRVAMHNMTRVYILIRTGMGAETKDSLGELG